MSLGLLCYTNNGDGKKNMILEMLRVRRAVKMLGDDVEFLYYVGRSLTGTKRRSSLPEEMRSQFLFESVL